MPNIDLMSLTAGLAGRMLKQAQVPTPAPTPPLSMPSWTIQPPQAGFDLGQLSTPGVPAGGPSPDAMQLTPPASIDPVLNPPETVRRATLQLPANPERGPRGAGEVGIREGTESRDPSAPSAYPEEAAPSPQAPPVPGSAGISPEALANLSRGLGPTDAPAIPATPESAAEQARRQMQEEAAVSRASAAGSDPRLGIVGVPEAPPEFHPGGANWEKMSPEEQALSWQRTLQGMDPQHAKVMLETIGRSGEVGAPEIAALNYLMARPGGQVGRASGGGWAEQAFGGMAEDVQISSALENAARANPALLSDPKFTALVSKLENRPGDIDWELPGMIREQAAAQSAIAASMKELGLTPPGAQAPGTLATADGAVSATPEAAVAAAGAPAPEAAPAPAEPAAPRETPRERRQREREDQQDQEAEARQRFADQGGMLPMPEAWRGTPDQWAAQWESLAPKGRAALARATERAEGKGAVATAPKGPVGITGQPLNTAWTPQGYYVLPTGRTGHAGLLEPLIARIAGPRGEFEKQAHEMAYSAFHQMLSDLQDWSVQASEMDLLAKHAMDTVEGDDRVKTAAANVFQADHVGRLMAEGHMIRMVGMMKNAGISVQPDQVSVDFGEPRIPVRKSGAYDASAGAREITPQDVVKSPGRQPGAE